MAKQHSSSRIRNQFDQQPDLEVVHLLSYEITFDPMEDKSLKKLPRQVKDRIEDLYYLAQENPKEAIPELLELKEKYPKVPLFYNYLNAAYTKMGDREKAEAVALENYQKHPDYLFAKLNYAGICLSKGEIEKIPEIFNNKFDLKLLYPNRNKFHVSEYVGFASTVGRYFCAIGKQEPAEVLYNTLEEIAPDHELTKALKRALFPSALARALKKLVKDSR